MDEAVMKLRTGFVKRAILRVRDMIASGRDDEARTAFSELRRYFDWMRDGIAPEERGRIFEQIEALPALMKGH